MSEPSKSHSKTNGRRGLARDVFVGREDELETLRSTFEDAVDGRLGELVGVGRLVTLMRGCCRLRVMIIS